MVTIRCTQKLLHRVRPTLAPKPATTRLGDWYANILFARPEQLVVCVSERTLLTVVVPARPASALGVRLAHGLANLLAALDVAPEQIAREVKEMSEFSFARTENRRVIGSMNEMVFHLSVYLQMEPELSQLEASLKLSRTPISAIGRGFPDKTTRALFSAAALIS